MARDPAAALCQRAGDGAGAAPVAGATGAAGGGRSRRAGHRRPGRAAGAAAAHGAACLLVAGVAAVALALAPLLVTARPHGRRTRTPRRRPPAAPLPPCGRARRPAPIAAPAEPTAAAADTGRHAAAAAPPSAGSRRRGRRRPLPDKPQRAVAPQGRASRDAKAAPRPPAAAVSRAGAGAPAWCSIAISPWGQVEVNGSAGRHHAAADAAGAAAGHAHHHRAQRGLPALHAARAGRPRAARHPQASLRIMTLAAPHPPVARSCWPSPLLAAAAPRRRRRRRRPPAWPR